MIKSGYRHILIFSVVIVIGIVIAIALFMLTHSTAKNTKELKSPPVTATINANTLRVFIKDFYTLERYIDSKTQQAVENALYGQALYMNQQIPDLFTGIIRPGSYSNTSKKDMNSTEFLVDIEPVNITYNVTVNEFRNFSRSILIKCAPHELQLNKSAACKELDGIV